MFEAPSSVLNQTYGMLQVTWNSYVKTNKKTHLIKLLIEALSCSHYKQVQKFTQLYPSWSFVVPPIESSFVKSQMYWDLPIS